VIKSDHLSHVADDERPHFVVRLARRLRPQEGYAVLLLAWIAVITLPAAAMQGALIVGLNATPGLATGALLLAWWLAHRRLRGYAAAALLAFSGIVAALDFGVYVLSPWAMAAQAGHWLVWWLGKRTLPPPAVTAFAEQGQALARYWQRAVWWTEGLVTGRGGADNLVVVGLACLLAWGAAAWAGWWLARNGKPFVALLPTAILLANQVYWASTGYWELLAFLWSISLLLVLLRLERQFRSWEQAGVDYSPEIRLDALFTALGIAFMVVILAPTLPFLTSRELSQAFWRVFENPYRQVEQHVDASFASIRPGRSLIPPSGVEPGGLPRAHLLGGRPELGKEIALRVRVRDALPGDHFYWRGQTFSVYTGRGWEEPAQNITRRPFNAGEPWTSSPPLASRHVVLAGVTVLAASRAVLYAPAEPISVDRPYWAEQEPAGDLVALGASGGPLQYTVLSAVPDVDANALRTTGTLYDPAITELYLQLPADLPSELVAYAAAITQGATGSTSAPRTPYDKAVAIEAALRRLTYTLDVPLPPQGRELVSWFLFDQRSGYCDYFATAMVVLARLNGIPARLAIGYTMGDLDPRTGDYVVTELQAHSWPELYFPGYGWIPFEPTPSQAVPARTDRAAASQPSAVPTPGYTEAGLAAGMAELQDLAAAQAAGQRRSLALRIALAALNGVLVCWFAGWLVWWRKRTPQVTVPGEAGDAYARLLRWGVRLGRPARPSDTPREYAAALAGAAAHVAARARVSRRAAVEAADVVRSAVGSLAQDYEAALYGAEQSVSIPSATAHPGRRTLLWAALRRLWLARKALA